MQVPFYTTDVFTSKAFSGAQIAVIPDADTLSEAQMQQIAGELNLWSTVFVNQAQSNKQFGLRMFSPQKEIDYASHTTIAAAQVLSSIGRIEKRDTDIVFRHKNNDLKVHLAQQSDGKQLNIISLVTAPVVDNYVPSNEELGELLSLDPKMLGIKNFRPLLVSNNGIYIVVPIHYLEQVQRAAFNQKAWNQSLAPNTMAQQILVFSPQTQTAGADFHLRLLGPQIDSREAPPVGAAIPAFAAYLCAHEHIKKGTYSFLAERGTEDKRQSILHVEVDNKGADTLTVRIGGHAVMVCEGKINL